MADVASTPTHVHPLQTKCKFASYQDFRHRRDHSERSAVLKAMRMAPQFFQERPAALRDCGSNAWLYKHKATGKIKVRTNFCGDRWCPACQRSHRHTVSTHLQAAVEAAQKAAPALGLSMLTLTVRSGTRSLAEQLTHLRSSFALLRRRTFFADACAGGIVSCEVTLNAQTLEWHPHLHVLLVARYIRHQQIREHWTRITGGSHVLHIGRLPSVHAGVVEVSKYITKPTALLGLPTWHRLEIMQAFKSRRLYSMFGTLRKTPVPEKPTREPFVDADWEMLGSVTMYIKCANGGDREAADVLGQIGLYTENWQDHPQSEMEFEP